MQSNRKTEGENRQSVGANNFARNIGRMDKTTWRHFNVRNPAYQSFCLNFKFAVQKMIKKN